MPGINNASLSPNRLSCGIRAHGRETPSPSGCVCPYPGSHFGFLIFSSFAASSVFHPVECSFCHSESMMGFRYRCQQCHNYQLCQDCFWRGHAGGSHSNQHQMKEYTSWVRQGPSVLKVGPRMLGNVREGDSIQGYTYPVANIPSSPSLQTHRILLGSLS